MKRRALFLQCTSAAAYPPVLNASALMAEAGWHVTVLSSPSQDVAALTATPQPRVRQLALPTRRSNAIQPLDYLLYWIASVGLALVLRPRVIYASDPLSAGPALWAVRVCGGRLIYHEHDSPRPGGFAPPIARWRRAAANAARLVITPNGERSKALRAELGLPADRVHTVWNTPRRAELPTPMSPNAPRVTLYYHGSITQGRLPKAVAIAVQRLAGKVALRIAGYEAPNAAGHVDALVQIGRGCGRGPALVEFVGAVPERADLLTAAARANVGLALMPLRSEDINMRHMTGASNKAFDYMAAGLPLLVSDLPDWRVMFVEPGYGLACDPEDPESIAAALTWFLDHPAERQAMGARGRAKIEADWNYDTAFASILEVLSDD